MKIKMIMIILLLGIEWNSKADERFPNYIKINLPNDIVLYESQISLLRGPPLGVNNPKSVDVHAVKTDTLHGIDLFDVHYQYDEFGRRKSIFQSNKKKAGGILLGCSYAFGIGVQAEDTLSSMLNKKSERLNFYNYAVPATGPQVALRQIELTDLKTQMPEKPEQAIFFYVDFHVERANAFLIESDWGSETPFYEKVDGHMNYVGTLRASRPIWYHILPMVRWIFNSFGIDRNFPRYGQSHFEYVANLFLEMKNRFQEQGLKFLVYFHPHGSPEKYDLMEPLLKARGISVLRSQVSVNPQDDLIPIDSHPTKNLNQKIVDELIENNKY